MTKTVNLRTRILIVEDQFIEANNLKQILKQAGYDVSGMAQSVFEALDLIDREMPDMVLLDIFLSGPRNGMELAAILRQKQIPFVYLSANSDRVILDEAKKTQPYGLGPEENAWWKTYLYQLDCCLYSSRRYRGGNDE